MSGIDMQPFAEIAYRDCDGSFRHDCRIRTDEYLPLGFMVSCLIDGTAGQTHEAVIRELLEMGDFESEGAWEFKKRLVAALNVDGSDDE